MDKLAQYLENALLVDLQDASVVFDASPSMAVLFREDALPQALTIFRQNLDDLFPDDVDVKQRFIPALATLLEQATASPQVNIELDNDATRHDLLSFLQIFLRQMVHKDTYIYPAFTALLDWAMAHHQHPLTRVELKRMVELRAFKEVRDIEYAYSDDMLLAMVRFGQETTALNLANARRNPSERYNILYEIYADLHASGKDKTRCIDLLIEAARQVNKQFPVWKRLTIHMSMIDLDDAIRLLPFIEDEAVRDDTLLELIVRQANDQNITTDRLLELLDRIEDWRVHAYALVPITLKVVDDPDEAERISRMHKTVIEPIQHFLELRVGYARQESHRTYEAVGFMYDFAKQIENPLIQSVALAETAACVKELRQYGRDGNVGQWHADIESQISDAEIMALTVAQEAWAEIAHDLDNAEVIMGKWMKKISEIRDVRIGVRLLIHLIRPFAEQRATGASYLLSKIKNYGLAARTPLALIENLADDYPETALALADDTHFRIDKPRAYAVIASRYVANGQVEPAQQLFGEALKMAEEIKGETKSKTLAYIAKHLIELDAVEAEKRLKEAKQLESMTHVSQLVKDLTLNRLALSQVNARPDFAHALVKSLNSAKLKIDVCQKLAEQYPDQRLELKDEIISYLRDVPNYEFTSVVQASLGIASLYDKETADEIFNETLRFTRVIKDPQTRARSLLLLALFTDDVDMQNQLFAEAENHAKGQHENYDRDSLLAHIAFERSKMNLENGLEAAHAIREPRFRAEALVNIAIYQAKNSGNADALFQEARTLIDTLTDTSVQGSLLNELIRYRLQAGEDIQDLLDAITDKQPLAFAYVSIIEHAAVDDVPKAFAYLDKMPVERHVASAVARVAPQLVAYDPRATNDLINRIKGTVDNKVARRFVAETYFDQGQIYKALMDLPTEKTEILLSILLQHLPEALSAQYDDAEQLFLDLIFVVLDTYTHVQPDWQDLRDIVASQLSNM